MTSTVPCEECDCSDPTAAPGLYLDCPCDCHVSLHRPRVDFDSATWRLIQWHIDPGHGWLRVPLELLEDKGLRESISPYSYMDHEFAYLEEDCDAARFADFYGITTHRFGSVRGDYADKHVDRGFKNPRYLDNYSARRAEKIIGPRAH